MKTYNQESGFAHIILLVLGVLAVSGVGTTVAANYSKPGDFLYGLDRATEQVQLALSLTNGMKESTNRSLAKERLDEIKALLATDNVDASKIAEALKGFEENKAQVASLLNNADPNHAKEVDDEFESRENEITKQFEAKQKGLETAREQLKKQLEAAKAKGNASEVAALQAQIDKFESWLKDLENERESSKKELETQEKAIEKHQDEATKVQEEAEHQAEQQAEAAKKAQEAAEEAAKKAAEAEKENSESH